MLEPDQCMTMIDVRKGVDTVDEQIVALLATRFRFMNAAARIKDRRAQVRDEERKKFVVERAESLARAAGVPSGVVSMLYTELVEASIDYELRRFDER